MKKAWLNTLNRGSKSLQKKLAKRHAKNPAYQDFSKKHGSNKSLSAAKSGTVEKRVAKVDEPSPDQPQMKISMKDRESIIRHAAEKTKMRRLANANRVAFGGELGGGYVLPRSGFRRYSEAYGDKFVPTRGLFDTHYIAYHKETNLIHKVGSNRHVRKFIKKHPELKIGYTSWNDKKVGDTFFPVKIDESKVADKIRSHPAVEYYGGADDDHFINLHKGWDMGDGQRSFGNENAREALKTLRQVRKTPINESQKKIVLGKRIPQLPGPKGGHVVPKGFKRVKDSHGFNMLHKIKEDLKFKDGIISMCRGGWVAKRGGVQIGPATTDVKVAQEYISRSMNSIGKKLKRVLDMKKKEIEGGLGKYSMTEVKLPFTPDPLRKDQGNLGITVGRRPVGLSRARWLARMALNKQLKQTKNEDSSMTNKKKTLTELKKSTLASYVKKAAPRIRSGTSLSKSFFDDAFPWLKLSNKHHPMVFDPKDPEGKDKNPAILAKADLNYDMTMKLSKDFGRGADNRIKGIQRAIKRLAKEEVVIEEGKNPYGAGFKLVHSKTGQVYNVGDKFKDEGETHTILGWQHGSQRGNPASSGRVSVKVGGKKGYKQEYFPHVFDMKVVKEDSAITQTAKSLFTKLKQEARGDDNDEYGSSKGFRDEYGRSWQDQQDAKKITMNSNPKGMTPEMKAAAKKRANKEFGRSVRRDAQKKFDKLGESKLDESKLHRLDATYTSAFVHGHNRPEDGRSARVFRNAGTGNWITKHYEDDRKVNHYETDGYEDAHTSAKKWVGKIRSVKYKGEKARLDESKKSK
jgi:hypothetical protein